MQMRPQLEPREVIAPTVKSRSGRSISKEGFDIDLAHDQVRCPQGHETGHWAWVRPRRGEPKERVKRFAFPQELCGACPRYAECVADKRGRGRFITLHPEEERLLAARAFPAH